MLLMWLIPSRIFSQSNEELDNSMEKLIENSGLAGDLNDLQEQFDGSANRMDLNRINTNDPSARLFLSEAQIRAIERHREEMGNFVSLLELQTVDEISPILLKRLLPFLTLDQPSLEWRNIPGELRSVQKEVTLTTSRQWPLEGINAGEARSEFEGSPNPFRLRLGLDPKSNIRVGLQAEKDAGEAFGRGSNRLGFDFYSGHLYLTGKKVIRKLVLGDFQAGFGQGLTFCSGLSPGKSSLVLNSKKQSQGLRPYRSMNENEFLRGAGITLARGKTELSLFVSKLRRDASTDNISNRHQAEQVVRTLLTDGYHRTETEIRNENAVNHWAIGQDLNIVIRGLHMGLTSTFQRFSRQLQPEENPANQHQFRGNSFLKGGVHFDYNQKNWNFFGELSKGNNRSEGYVLGLMVSLSGSVDLNVTTRYFSPSYLWYYSAAFSENTRTNNEQGTYAGGVIHINRQLSFSAYLDSYRFPFYSYGADGPSRGWDYLAEINFHPHRKTQLYIRFRNKREQKNRAVNYYNQLAWMERGNCRIHLETQPFPAWRMQLRMEFSRYVSVFGDGSKGNLIFVDLNYKPVFSKLSASFRVTQFSTEGYDARIYAVENDLLYSWSVPAFSGSGIRFYGLIKFKLPGNIHLQGRYAITRQYPVSGSSLPPNQTTATNLHELNLLISFRFR